MGPIEHVAKSLAAHMGIDLGSGQIFVPKQFLHAAKICIAIQEMSSKGVAQRVRVSGFQRSAIQYPPHIARGKRLGTHVGKNQISDLAISTEQTSAFAQ